MTKTGRTAQLISSYRPDVPILCICPTHKVGRQLQIYRGCHPIVDEDLRETNFWERGFEATKLCKELKFVLPGDKVVLVTAEKGDGLGLCMGMKVGTVGAE
jgi:pyruvate kinase